MDDSPIYSDDLSRRNSEVYRLTTALYDSGAKGSTLEEQAHVCLALLMGYNASFIDYGEKQQHIQEVLDRCWDLLDVLPASLLKLRLLTACYGEVFDEPLADEAVPSSLRGIPRRLLLKSRRPLQNFRMWWTILIRGSILRSEIEEWSGKQNDFHLVMSFVETQNHYVLIKLFYNETLLNNDQ